MKKILVECKDSAIDREIKLCATSLESMVEFYMMRLGTRDVIGMLNNGKREE